MQKETTKYVIDSRYFRGSCVTIMSDGTHCDYFGTTLEELREKEGNPYLIALPIKPLAKRVHIYMESLCGPFEEVSEARYYDQLNVLPPIRHNRNSFFLTSSPCHPKIIREQWCDALMPFHEHGSSNGLFIPGQRHLYCHNSPGKFEHLVHTHVYV